MEPCQKWISSCFVKPSQQLQSIHQVFIIAKLGGHKKSVLNKNFIAIEIRFLQISISLANFRKHRLHFNAYARTIVFSFPIQLPEQSTSVVFTQFDDFVSFVGYIHSCRALVDTRICCESETLKHMRRVKIFFFFKWWNFEEVFGTNT